MSTPLSLLSLLITVSTWLTPLPRHAQGRLVYYGPQPLVEANAAFRGYDLSPYRDRCGLAVMSPADLGRIVWVRLPDSFWYGPCLAVDVAKRDDFYRLVVEVREVAEVSARVRDLYHFTHGIMGEVFVGACPPVSASLAKPYVLTPTWDAPPFEPTPSFYPYPHQELPRHCGTAKAR